MSTEPLLTTPRPSFNPSSTTSAAANPSSTSPSSPTTPPQLADGFWEVGASGNRYSRDYVLEIVATHADDTTASTWTSEDHHCRQLSPDTYLSPTPCIKVTASPAAQPSGRKPIQAGKPSSTKAPSSPSLTLVKSNQPLTPSAADQLPPPQLQSPPPDYPSRASPQNSAASFVRATSLCCKPSHPQSICHLQPPTSCPR